MGDWTLCRILKLLAKFDFRARVFGRSNGFESQRLNQNRAKPHSLFCPSGEELEKAFDGQMDGVADLVAAVPGVDRRVVRAVAPGRHAGAREIRRDHDRALRATDRGKPAHERQSGADRRGAGEAGETVGWLTLPPSCLTSLADELSSRPARVDSYFDFRSFAFVKGKTTDEESCSCREQHYWQR